jgi:hypothetical protein
MRKRLATMLVLALLLVSFAQLVKANLPSFFPRELQDLTGEDKILADTALQFLNNVANVNTSSYHIIANEAHSVLSGKTLKFTLSSSAGILSVIAEFANGRLFWCSILPVKGSPALNQPVSSNILSTAKDTLDRLQAFSTRDYLPTFQSMLNSVTELQDSKTSNANYTQEITVSGSTIRISWEPFVNDLSNPQYRLFLEFRNGNLEYYADYLGIDVYSIGSSEVEISEAQAIQIAIERVRVFSYVQDGETVSDFTILDSLVIANVSLWNRGNTLYPFWSIKLPLDKEYPGGVTAFQVGIWADTGEVSYFTPIGYYGDLDASESPPPESSATLPTGVILYASAVVATIVISVVALALKKRKHQTGMVEV